jgi:FdhD protein
MPASSHISLVGVRRIVGIRAHSARDNVAVEDPLEIQIGQERNGLRTVRSVSVTMRTPGNDAELAVGFLFGEGLLNQRSDVADIQFPAEATNCVRIRLRPGLLVDVKQLNRNFYTTSSCGVCGKASLDAVHKMARGALCNETGTLRVPAAMVHQMPARLRESQRVFERTGGLHAAALFDCTGELCLLREDVGRHNAVDKVVGAEWLQDHIPIANRILFVSGRASFELVQKAVRAGIPMLAAVGAPSSLAIELAEAFGLTLLGFVRDGRFNIYSADFRIFDAKGIDVVVR